MLRSVSIVVPVLNGARYLEELLIAAQAQAADAADLELLVIDSGSTDGSPELARSAGADVIELSPQEFGHGRTRNLGAERTSGELICFLTQDATPLPGWLAAFQAAFELDPRVGAAYGPHRPRPDTSPMIARELEEFFALHAPPDGGPALQRRGEDAYLSNVNACYLRECWSELRFPDIPYSEDQAFGRMMLEAGWVKVFQPRAAVLHAHDYPPVGFMRRYFDEYRGLRETVGHVEPFGVRTAAGHVKNSVAADRRWMRERGFSGREQATWLARGAVHHGGRKVFSALGSRGHRLPPGVQRRISLEGTVVAADPGLRTSANAANPGTTPVPARGPVPYQEILQLARDGPAPLLEPVPGMSKRARLHLAVVIPPFRRGSGGHNSIFQMLSRLERRGHTISIWLHDPIGMQRDEWPAVIRDNINDWFAPLEAPVFKGFTDWYGADIIVATGWQTTYPAMLIGDARVRAYLVHDHENEFYATSAESWWAEQSYLLGMHAVTASPWLARLIERRYGGTTSPFEFGVDHAVYFPRPVTRRGDTILFYARDVTPRRAVPLGVLALEELHRRRPDLRFLLFGDPKPIGTPFPYEHLGIASPGQLATVFSEATVGLCLSMTNYSLIPQEMLACGLPCVDLAGFSSETVFGADGPIELSPFDPVQLADALERLIDDRALWTRRSDAGRAFVAERSWDRSSAQVEAGLRVALELRERQALARQVANGETPSTTHAAVPVAATARAVPVEIFGATPVTDLLYDRLAPEDVSAVETALDDWTLSFWIPTPPERRRQLALAFGVWHDVPAVLEKTGLTRAEPPEDVHALARGPLAAGGAYYEADLVVEALELAGGSLKDVRRALDFGCSSGRVVRVLATAHPDIEWHGVDPNERAIEWAREHLAGARFATSPTDPPLPFADADFDLVCAISIWSHFGEGAALRWFDEMGRVIAAGGRLVFTTHGLQSLAYSGAQGLRTPRQLEQIRQTLYRSGFWFGAEFGETGDFGVKHSEWGTAFISPEWLLRRLTPGWTVEHYAVGRNAGNQDVVVLVRR